jgi:hypothetical protein
MTQDLDEGALRFRFPDGWGVRKLDETSFFKKRFQSFAKPPIGEGSKSVDFVAYDPEDVDLWLIEVKDFRIQPRGKKSELTLEIALKVRDSLACIHAMASLAGCDDEHFAKRALRKHHIRVVLHIEQPAKPSKLKPAASDIATLKQKLKQAMRAVDPHALAGGMTVLNAQTPWAEEQIEGAHARAQSPGAISPPS